MKNVRAIYKVAGPAQVNLRKWGDTEELSALWDIPNEFAVSEE